MSESEFNLRATHLDDVLPYTQFLSDPQISVWLDDTAQRPMSTGRVQALLLQEAWCLWAIDIDGSLVGVSSLYEPDAARGTASLSIVIGDRRFWGRGLGTAVVRRVLAHGFETLGLRKINSDVLEPNAAALKLHSRIGFQEEGRLRQDAWRQGRWVDRVLFSLLADEYRLRHIDGKTKEEAQ